MHRLSDRVYQVLAQNVPKGRRTYTLPIVMIGATGSGWWYTVLGDAVVVAAINLGDMAECATECSCGN